MDSFTEEHKNKIRALARRAHEKTGASWPVSILVRGIPGRPSEESIIVAVAEDGTLTEVK